jgi:PAS domain S-box-containing protein
MALVALDGRWLRVNRSLCELTGYSEKELLRGSFQEITHPEDLDVDLEFVRQMLAGERSAYRMDKRYVRKDGEIVWASLSVSLVRDADDVPLIFVSQIEDITERRRMVAELEQRGRLMDLAHDAIIVRGASDSTVIYWNQAAEAVYGYRATAALGRITHELLHTEFPESREAVDAALRERGRWEGELIHIREDGHRILVSSRQALERGPRGEPRAIIELNSDITEQRQTQRALSQVENRHRLVVETLAEGVVLFDELGRNVETNPAAARMIGMSSDEVAGALVHDQRWRMVREDGTDYAPDELPAEITRTTGEPQTGVVMGMRSPDGALRWLAVSTRVLEARSAPPHPVVASFDDITSLKRAEHEARQRLAELERATGQDMTVLEALVAQSEVGLAFLDRDLRFAHVNDALAAINGLPVEAHIGHTMLELFGELGASTHELVRSVCDGGEPLTDHELTLSEPHDGRTYRVSYWPVRDRAGDLLGVSTMVVDITADKEADRERDRLLARERRAADRMARLQRVAAALTAALSVEDVAKVLVREATAAVDIPRGWIALMSADRTTIEWTASIGFDGVDVGHFARVPLDAHSPGPDAIRNRQARYFSTAEAQARAYPHLAAAFRAAGHEAGAVIPILAGTGPLGTIGLSSLRPHAFDADDRILLETIAGLCAQALERAAAYEREHATAQTLTRSLLPAHLPEIPGVALGHRYAPTPLLDSAVGGDFYDVVPLDGASWLMIVGDVAGKGPEAAALTGLVRYTLRAEAQHDSRPDRLLSVLNDAILTQRADGRFCTLACVRLDLRDPADARLELSSAGHPAPLLMHGDGRVELVHAPGQLLGIFAGANYSVRRIAFTPESTLVLYTDGLLDASAPEHELTADELADRLASESAPSDPQSLVDHLYERAVGDRAREPRDDIAILAARLVN